MDFDKYQAASASFSRYPIIGGHGVTYPIIGLSGEVGEVSDKFKKIFRDNGGVINESDRQAFKNELGDVLWYVSQICTELDLALEDVAMANLDKLADRDRRGAIGGSGDDR